jgi:hypothetical protein
VIFDLASEQMLSNGREIAQKYPAENVTRNFRGFTDFFDTPPTHFCSRFA